MNFSTLTTLGQPLPQIRLPKSDWAAVGRTVRDRSWRSWPFTGSTGNHFIPIVRWSPELAALRYERHKAMQRACQNRLRAERQGKPTDEFPARIRHKTLGRQRLKKRKRTSIPIEPIREP